MTARDRVEYCREQLLSAYAQYMSDELAQEALLWYAEQMIEALKGYAAEYKASTGHRLYVPDRAMRMISLVCGRM